MTPTSRVLLSTVLVKCAPEIEIERVMHGRNMSEQDARARLAAQGSLDEKLKQAQVIIDNSGDEASTLAQVRQAWSRKMMHIVQRRPMRSESIPATMRPAAFPMASIRCRRASDRA